MNFFLNLCIEKGNLQHKFIKTYLMQQLRKLHKNSTKIPK